MALRNLFKGSIKQSVFEIFLIVIGVLLALWVDDWRAEVAERKSVQRHLIGIKEEIDYNLLSLYMIRDHASPGQIDALEEVIRVVSEPEPYIEDPEAFMQMLIASAEDLAPWHTRASFDSFRSSPDFHSDFIPGVGVMLSGTYEAQNVLFYQRFADSDAYSDAVSRLVPARYQSENNEMRGYVPGRFSSPIIADDQSAANAIAVVIDNRAEIASLARSKARRITGKWYAMTRIIMGFEEAHDAILEHPLMQDVEIPISEIADALAEMRP